MIMIIRITMVDIDDQVMLGAFPLVLPDFPVRLRRSDSLATGNADDGHDDDDDDDNDDDDYRKHSIPRDSCRWCQRWWWRCWW